jgi:hypothetical protein
VTQTAAPVASDVRSCRLDGATGAVRETISTGPNPAVVAGAAEDVWVSIFEGGQVWRIHPG